MKRTQITFVLVVILTLMASTITSAQTSPQRNKEVYVPTWYDPETTGPMPLIVVLHGYGVPTIEMASYTGFNHFAEAGGFVVAYPEAIDLTWNNLNSNDHMQVDDVEFITRVIDEVNIEVAIDYDRVYLVGHSTGAMMAHRVACEAPGVFRAVAAVAGTMPRYLLDDCAEDAYASFLIIHRVFDTTVLWNGDEQLASVDETVKFWATQNGCPNVEETFTVYVDLFDENGVMLIGASNCEHGKRVALLSTNYGAHDWPGARYPNGQPADPDDVDATRLILSFIVGVESDNNKQETTSD